MENVGTSESLARLCTAVVFCGGRATRLQDHLRGTAKALVLLERRPYLHSLLLSIRNAGLKQVILCISPFTRDIIELVRGGREYGLRVQYSLDSGMRENADALWQARRKIHSPLAICINGDTIFDVDFHVLIETHLRRKVIATLVASDRMDQPHPGGVELTYEGKVVDLHEWAQDHQLAIDRSSVSTACSNSGIYIFDIQALKTVWSDTDKAGRIEQGLLRSLARKGQLAALRNADRYLLDLGTPERLKSARSQLDLISHFFAI